MSSVVIFGDDYGVQQLIPHIPSDYKIFPVSSSIRSSPKTFYPAFVQPSKHMQPYYKTFKESLSAIEPDFIFSHSYSMFIPGEILSIPKNGAINVHFSYLPKYRGANPIQWAIINGETKTGVTLHYMTEEIDAGDIIARCEVPILITDTWVDVTQKCKDAADKLLKINIPKILNGTNKKIPQEDFPEKPTRFPRRKPEDGYFTWGSPSVDIYNKIRALVKPHPGAFYCCNSLNGVQTKIVIDEYKTLEWVKHMKVERGYI